MPKISQFRDGRFCVSFYLDGKRHRETYSDRRSAQHRANEIERLKGKGLSIALKSRVVVDEAANYATNCLEARGITKPLTSIVDEYIAAQEVLQDKGTLLEACRFFAQNQDDVDPIQVADLVADYDRYLARQKVSPGHQEKTVQIYLKRFARDFPCPIHLITLKDLEKWRATFTTGARTVNNYCNAVKALFNYAKDRKHLRQNAPTEASKLKPIEEPATEANPFTLDEMAILLTQADEKNLPYLVLGAFAGIRTAEQGRLTWEQNVCWDKGYFELTGSVTKKKMRRLIPILPVAADWLQPFKGRKGPVLQEAHPERNLTQILEEYGYTWRHNGLRDSFGTNRAAVLKNLNDVAMEMGNSPAMVIESYREVVSEEQAKLFWQLNRKNAERLFRQITHSS